MPLSLICPECGGKLKIAENLAGKRIKCPKCSAVFPVPTGAEAAVTVETPPTQPEGVTPSVAPEPEIVDERRLRPRLRDPDIHRDPTSEAVSTLIPYKNARALIAYYCGVFSLIPCAGLALGPVAFILGILGLRYVRAHPTAHGTAHAIVGIILGGLTALGNWGIVIAAIVMGGLAAFKSQGTPTMGNPPIAIVKPANLAPQEIDLGQPLFAADRDLVDPNGKLNIPAEPGRVAALRMGSAIHAVAFSPDGKTLAVANQLDVKLWDVAAGKSRTIPVFAGSLAFSPDGKHLAMGHDANQIERAALIELYDPRTANLGTKLLHRTVGDAAERMAFSPDGKWFASTSGSTFKIWDTATWRIREPDFQAPGLLIGALAFDPKDPKTLAVIMNQRVLFWDTTVMKEKFSLKGAAIGGTAITLTSDGNTLASGTIKGDIDLWDVAQRKSLRRLSGHRGMMQSLFFTADNKVLISAGSTDGTIRLWDVAKGKELTRRNTDAPGKKLTAFAASPDGKILVSGSDGGIVKVWDVAQLRGQAK